MQKIYLTYDQLHQRSHELIEQIRQSNFLPTCVVAVAMGGLSIGYHLVKGLCIDAFYTLRVQSYQGTHQENIILLANQLPDLSGESVLLVDDLVDSGRTLQYVQQHLLGITKDLRVATWIYNSQSVIKPDFSVQQYDKERLVFPYEEFEEINFTK